MDLTLVAKQARWNSERWFPQLHNGDIDMSVFYALALAGEVGEAANLVKKAMREDRYVIDTPEHKEAFASELADIFTYLLLLADENHIDLIEAFEKKQAVCEERWGR